MTERLKSEVAQAVAAERERCAVLVGSFPTKQYGGHAEMLLVQRACVDMAAAIRQSSAQLTRHRP